MKKKDQAKPIISVIVPVYKVEQYLETCIRSILRQTYQDFELILVDDGSPDHCGEICDEFAKMDSRIKVIHQVNGGVSLARNVGMENAEGEWLCFVDADDILLPRYLEYFSRYWDGQDELLLQGRLKLIKGKLCERFAFRFTNTQSSLKEAVSDCSCIGYCTPWGKLFRTEIIRNNKIVFPIGIAYGEDSVFFFRYLSHVDKIRTIGSYRYIYRVGREAAATEIPHDPFMYLIHLELVHRALSELSMKAGKRVDFLSCSIEDRVMTMLVFSHVLEYRYSNFKHLVNAIKKSNAVNLYSIAPKKLKLRFFFFLLKHVHPAVVFLCTRIMWRNA